MGFNVIKLREFIDKCLNDGTISPDGLVFIDGSEIIGLHSGSLDLFLFSEIDDDEDDDD
jgi:hypothetical protein